MLFSHEMYVVDQFDEVFINTYFLELSNHPLLVGEVLV